MSTQENTITRLQQVLYPVQLPGSGKKRTFLSQLAQLWPIGIVLIALPFALKMGDGIRLLLSASIFIVLYSVRSVSLCVLFACLYLCLLGGLRRWMGSFLGATEFDLYLLICPIFVLLWVGGQAFARQLPHDTTTARLLFGLLGVMVIQIFNPRQGGLTVGLAGALFYIVPVSWYFLGRKFGTVRFIRTFQGMLVAIAILAALHGLYQTYFGFTEAELAWGRLSVNVASSVGGTLRPMSTFTHSGEYAYILCKGVLLLWAFWLCRRNNALLLPIPLLVVGAFLVGSRGAIVMTLAACVALYAVQGRTVVSWIPRGLLALAIGVIGLVFSLQRVQEQSASKQTADVIKHQTEGLLNPMDQKKSTASIHSGMIQVGFASGLSSPLGEGLGTTTIAAAKFGGATHGTEFDVTNMFVSLGLLGGLLYCAVIVVVLRMAFRYWHRARTPEALGMLGILVISLGQWLNGGLYAHTMLIWVCIGALDESHRRSEFQNGEHGLPIAGKLR